MENFLYETNNRLIRILDDSYIAIPKQTKTLELLARPKWEGSIEGVRAHLHNTMGGQKKLRNKLELNWAKLSSSGNWLLHVVLFHEDITQLELNNSNP